MSRKPYPHDVTDDEWNFVAPYLTLMREDAPQREYPLREVFNGLRYISRCGGPWRMLPTICRPGQWFTSRCSAGTWPASSRRWSMICGRFCGFWTS